MSGHNKWSKIKRQKGATDAKRSKAFSRILKEVTVAVKESGPDPDGNPHSGEGWSTDTDGTVLCGPTDIYFEDFAFSGGCSRWTISGKNCAPVMP